MAKKIFQSKTVWLAILQAVAGIFAVILTENPTLVTVGWVGIVKSIVDVAVRVFLTSTAVRL
jgi:hypothetical protein